MKEIKNSKPLFTNNSRKYNHVPMYRKGKSKFKRKKVWEDFCTWCDWINEK